MEATLEIVGRRRRFALFALIALWPVVTIFALGTGTYRLEGTRIVEILVGREEGVAARVLWNFRLPRIASALLCGWGLSLGGLLLQAVLRNPLASPATLGVSQGAAFGAALAAVTVGGGGTTLMGGAVLGAGVAIAALLLLGGRGGLGAREIVLAGVALSSLFVSGTMVVQFLASEEELARVLFWSFGDLARGDGTSCLLILVVVLAVTLPVWRRRWELNALEAGEETAEGLGVDCGRLRLGAMVAVAAVTGVVTAHHGVIAFMGLLAPHLARRLVGAEQGWLLPASVLTGGVLLLGADTAGRVLLPSGSLPVGVLSSFLGAPCFLALLLGRRS